MAETLNPNLSLDLVLFALDEIRFALKLEAVERVILAVAISPLPNAPAIVHGVINLHGRVVPVVDFRMRFGLREKPLTALDLMVIASDQKRIYGFVTDRTDGLVRIDAQHLVSAEQFLNELPHLEGVAKLRDGLIVVHDIGRFLSLDEEAQLEEALL